MSADLNEAFETAGDRVVPALALTMLGASIAETNRVTNNLIELERDGRIAAEDQLRDVMKAVTVLLQYTPPAFVRPWMRKVIACGYGMANGIGERPRKPRLLDGPDDEDEPFLQEWDEAEHGLWREKWEPST